MHSESGPREPAVLDTLHAVGEETRATPEQVAIAWLRHRAGMSPTALIPLVGARTRAQRDDNLEALTMTLSEDQARRLDEASAIPPGFPHEMLAVDRYG